MHARSWIFGTGFVLLFGVLLFTSCGQGTVGQEEEIRNIETSRALTAEAITPSPEPTVAQPTDTPTVTTPSPTGTARPSPTAPPPSPTPNAALRGFSFCNQQVSTVEQVTQGRFSARLQQVSAETFPAFERLVFDFELAPDSAPLSASANCVSERDFRITTGEPVAPAAYVLEMHLPGWLHDEAFDTSVLSDTMRFTETSTVQGVDMLTDADAVAGATITLGLSEVREFRLTLSEEPLQLLVDVARTSSLNESSDSLTRPSSGGSTDLPAPVFFLLDGEIKRIDDSDTITLTESLENEIALDVSPDGDLVAYCRTQEPGALPQEAGLTVPGALWLMEANGSNQRQIASVGVNCNDVAFSPDGSMIAFSVDETGAEPGHHAIWTVPLSPTSELTETVMVDETGARRIAGDKEWNRVAPQWIDENTLIYAASAQDGRQTLFLHRLSETQEHDVGAALVVGEQYRALGRHLAAPDGQGIAVEALRVQDAGADLVLLDANGATQETISEGFWNRPLAWSDDGSLFYLTTACTSTLVQEYTLSMRDSSGSARLLSSGSTLGTFGDAVALDGGLAYVAAERAEPGQRGAGSIALQSASAIWFLDPANDVRRQVYAAERRITTLMK